MTEEKKPQISNEANSKETPSETTPEVNESISEQNTASTKAESIKTEVEKVEHKQTAQQEKKNLHQMKATAPTHENKLSKTAVLALLIALASAAGVGGIHYLHTIENANQNDAFAQQLSALHQTNEQKINQLMHAQKNALEQQLTSALDEISNNSQTRISQLEQQIARLEQNQPSDWLLHEAEYLIRIASRTIWLEHDTQAAINLLTDAEARIKELNDPHYLPTRQLIKEDIAALSLMPTLNTEDIILSLLAMHKQIPMLNVAMAKIPDSQANEDDLELTENAADWRSNLAKTWRKFLADFITVRRRTGDVEPLMSPQYQQNLKENLALKLQQAQWAASEEKSQLYVKTLEDIQQWLTEYYDLGHLETAKFFQQLQALKAELVSYDFPEQLKSLNAIRKLIAEKSSVQKVSIIPAEAVDKKITEQEKNTPESTEPSSTSAEEEVMPSTPENETKIDNTNEKSEDA